MSDFRAQQIAIVETYLDAGLLQHKPENVLFAENCTRSVLNTLGKSLSVLRTRERQFKTHVLKLR